MVDCSIGTYMCWPVLVVMVRVMGGMLDESAS